MLNDIKLRTKKLREQVTRYQGNMDGLIGRQAELFYQMTEAQEYLDNRDNILAALEKIQERAQARDKLVFENILTTLIREVLPQKKDKVLFTTGTSNNKTTLEIELDINGNIENIVDKGGSVKNIMSVGLRCLALSQTRNRWFLAFDESDCWLKTHHIPQFAQILSELSTKLGIQMVYVSHHDPAVFNGKARILELSREVDEKTGDTIITPEIVGDVEPLVSGDSESATFSEGMGLDSIRLVNFKNHTNTRFDLSSGVTIITGDVDLGKSTLIEAIRCVQENDCENRIRHGEKSAKVEITIEDDMTIVWQIDEPKRRKGADKKPGIGKATYALYSGDGEEIYAPQSYKKKQIPAWLHDYLAMGPVNGIQQLHIASQDNPNFLIDSATTAQKRSEILSLNRQSSVVHKMIELHGKRTREYVRQMNIWQKDLSKVKQEMERIRPICNLADDITSLEETLARISDKLSSEEQLNKLLKKLTHITSKSVSINNGLQMLDALPEAPKLADTGTIQAKSKKLINLLKLTEQMSKINGIKTPKTPVLADVMSIRGQGVKLGGLEAATQQMAKIDSMKPAVAPTLNDVSTMFTKAKRLSQATELSNMLSQLPQGALVTPAVEDTVTLQQRSEKLTQCNTRQREASHEFMCHEVQKEVANAVRSNIGEALGNECPICGGEMKFEEHNHETAA